MVSESVVSADEVAEAVQSHPRVSAVGGRTKPALIGTGEEIELSGLSGIIEYEASEYTFTAKAGTGVREIEEALRAKGQYLPFDPLFVEEGATLGGTVASGVSGPSRFRYGGLRDFLIGVQFVDGLGKLVRSGGKVVKNAAGFDLPKFLVGSMGRFGILTELSFKVFPAPMETATLRIQCSDHAEAVERLAEVASSRWEADALDYDAGARVLHLRLGGPRVALEKLSIEIEGRWSGTVERDEEEGVWSRVRSAQWASGACLAKVPVTPSKIVKLEARLAENIGVQRWYSSGGAVAWLSFADGQRAGIAEALSALSLGGVVLRGGAEGEGPWLGTVGETAVLGAVKAALDPAKRFPAI